MLKLAMDKSSRTVDRFGRMYVDASNISKAIVNPYYGREIPNGEGLGLDPDRVYMLLRDPEELRKAAPTFNNIPLLDRHIPVTADEPSKEFVVGSTGTDAMFDEPYLRNSLVIWCANAIAGVKTNMQRELSSAYSYDADMTPGTYEGTPYDGIMRNIRGNHVALVEAGRAGPDVVVGDSKLSERPKMSKKKLSANARLLKVALMAYLPQVIAQDAKIGDLTAIVGSVKSLKPAKEKTRVAEAVKAAFGDKLAQDATLDGIVKLLDVLGDEEDVAQDEDDEDIDPETGKPRVKPEPVAKDEDKPATVDKPAMDAAIAAAVAKAQSDTVARMNAIHQAERDVEPFIGKLAIAQDSAANVYKLALDAAKIDTTGVDPSAFKAMVGMLPKPGDASNKAPLLAQDSAGGAKSFSEMFPNASKMKGGV